MKGKTHVILGTATLLAMAIKYPQGISVMGMDMSLYPALLTVSAGSYGPDIDLQQSHLGQKYKLISKHMKHRGITHTLLVPAICTAIMYTVSAIPLLASLVFGFMFGWVIHIFADWFNGKGVPILWPLTSKKFCVPVIHFSAGTWKETVFMLLWLGGLAAWLMLY